MSVAYVPGSFGGSFDLTAMNQPGSQGQGFGGLPQFNPIGQPLNSPFYANLFPQAGLNALGNTMQAGQGAVDLFNTRQSELFGNMANSIAGLQPAAAQFAGDIMGTANQQASGLQDISQQGYQDVVSAAGDVSAAAREYGDKAIAAARAGIAEYDEESYADVAAFAGSVSEQTQNQLADLQGIGGADMSPAQRSAMEAQIRSNGLKSLQGPVGQMFNQRRQFKAGLNMQLAGVINQTGQIVAGAEAQEAGLIANAAAARNNAYTSAAQIVTSSQQAASAMQMQAAQAEVAGYGQLAQLASQYPPQFFNQFDSYLQSMMVMENYGGFNTPTDVYEDFAEGAFG